MRLMELKTRSTVAVLPSDVIQLSAQRIALEDELGLQVTDEAFVLIPARAPAPFAVRAVQLMSRTAIDALVERRWRLMDGVEVPRWPEKENVCRRCGQWAACRDAGERLVGGSPKAAEVLASASAVSGPPVGRVPWVHPGCFEASSR